MNDITMKFLIVEVDGEAVLRFPIMSTSNDSNFEMIEAVLASNPVLRLVDNANVGDIWDGQIFKAPPVTKS
jgi:hypothetical protein